LNGSQKALIKRDGRSFKQYETLKDLYEAAEIDYPNDLEKDFNERIKAFTEEIK